LFREQKDETENVVGQIPGSMVYNRYGEAFVFWHAKYGKKIDEQKLVEADISRRRG